MQDFLDERRLITEMIDDATAEMLGQIDAASGFLVDRATTIKLSEDGLIKEFNGTATGQGGPLLVSLVKLDFRYERWPIDEAREAARLANLLRAERGESSRDRMRLVFKDVPVAAKCSCST